MADKSTVPQISSCSRSHEHVVSSCAFAPNGHLLCTASWDKSLMLYNVATGEFRTRGPTTHVGHEGCISSCVYSPDGERSVAWCRYIHFHAHMYVLTLTCMTIHLLSITQLVPLINVCPCVGTMVASGGYDGLLNVYSDPSKSTPKLSLRVSSTWHLTVTTCCWH